MTIFSIYKTTVNLGVVYTQKKPIHYVLALSKTIYINIFPIFFL